MRFLLTKFELLAMTVITAQLQMTKSVASKSTLNPNHLMTPLYVNFVVAFKSESTINLSMKYCSFLYALILVVPSIVEEYLVFMGPFVIESSRCVSFCKFIEYFLKKYMGTATNTIAIKFQGTITQMKTTSTITLQRFKSASLKIIGSMKSVTEMSLENLVRIVPMAFESKNWIGALNSDQDIRV